MKRPLATLLVAFLAALGWPAASAQSEPGRSAQRTYEGNLEVSRAAVARVAERFDAAVPFPGEARKYFSDFPISFAHPSEEPLSLRQPNGASFAARIRPMEVGGGVETWNTGLTLLKNKARWWTYAVPIRGRLAPSQARAGIDAPPAGLSPHLGVVEHTIWATPENLAEVRSQLFAYMAARSRVQNQAAAAADEPRIFKIPVLMLETYSEFEEKSTPKYFERFLSGRGGNPNGTMTELYDEMSYGKFQVDADVYGPYVSALSQPYRCYYGTEGSIVAGEMPIIGQVGLGGGGAKGMAAEAVPQADPEVDFGQYDNDLDGWVDYTILLHSGPDAAATGDPCHTWSHFFPRIVGEPAATTSDTNADGEPVNVGNVMTVPEIDLQIGVAAHEMMHALGEPDFYATDYSNSGTGDWDLGAGGSWYGDPPGASPLHFNPMIKMTQQWAEPTLIRKTTRGVELRPREEFADLLWVPIKLSKETELCEQGQFGFENLTSAFMVGERCAVEGYLIEHNSRSVPGAIFDRYSLSSGLLVWHYDLGEWDQGGNNDFLRPMLDLEEFDRRDETQDLQLNNTRGDPLDAFFGDVVGMSTATGDRSDEVVQVQDPEEFTVTQAVPCACTSGPTYAQPAPQFEVESADVSALVVSLGWGQDANDWDLFVDRRDGDTWTQVGRSAGSANPEVASIVRPLPGTYRVRAYNWASAEPTANVKVEFRGGGIPILQTANTLSNDLVKTGWSFTNIRPFAYDGLAVPFEHGNHTITLDVIRHNENTYDLSPDFIDVNGKLFLADQPQKLTTSVYQHGGKPVPAGTRVMFRLNGPRGKVIDRRVLGAIPPYGQREASIVWTPPHAGEFTIWTQAVHPEVHGLVLNNRIRNEIEVFPQKARVLIVDDDDGFEAEEAYAGALQGLGLPYAIVQETATAKILSRFDAVIWHTANARFNGAMSAQDRNAVVGYLQQGGRFWLAGPNVARALDADDPRVGQVAPQFLHDYFGVAHTDSVQRGAGPIKGVDKAISAGDTYNLRVPYARTSMDVVRLGTAEEENASTLGKATAVFRFPSQGAGALVGSRLVADKKAGSFRTVLTTFDIHQIASGPGRVELARDVLGWLGVQAGNAQGAVAIRHAPIRVTNPGRPATLTAAVAGDPDSVRLHYRSHVAGGWTVLEMEGPAAGHFTATIPKQDVVQGGVDYYISVKKGSRTVVSPESAPEVPHHIAILGPRGPGQ